MEKKDLITDLSNTKIDLSKVSFEVRKKVQERAFELGWTWALGERIIMDYPYLFFYLDMCIAYATEDDHKDFMQNSFKEIQIEDILGYTLKELPSDERQQPCPNCKEEKTECACMRNKCHKCGKPVGNITFSVCDDCWDGVPSDADEIKKKGLDLEKMSKKLDAALQKDYEEIAATILHDIEFQDEKAICMAVIGLGKYLKDKDDSVLMELIEVKAENESLKAERDKLLKELAKYQGKNQRVSFSDAEIILDDIVKGKSIDKLLPNRTYVEDYAGGSEEYYSKPVVIKLIKRLTR